MRGIGPFVSIEVVFNGSLYGAGSVGDESILVNDVSEVEGDALSSTLSSAESGSDICEGESNVVSSTLVTSGVKAGLSALPLPVDSAVRLF